MSASIQAKAEIANLMKSLGNKDISEKISTEDKFISYLAKFHHVEYACGEDQVFYLSLYESEHYRNKPPIVESNVGDIHIRLFSCYGFISVQQSSNTVSLKGEKIDSTLFAHDVLQRIVPQAQNESQYNSNNKASE